MTRLFSGLLGALAVVVAAAGPGWSQVEVSASVDETTIGTNDVARYTIQISGAAFSQIQNPSPPSARGLTLIQRAASTQQSISIVNSEVQQSIGFTWQYRPDGPGEATIGSATVNVGGRPYTTEPITVEILPPDQVTARSTRPGTQTETPGLSEEDVFIQATMNKGKVYQNEQVVLEYVLYFRHGVLLRNSRLADSWDTGGFWREDLDVEQRSTMRSEIVNGLRYNAVTLKRVSLFPTRSGELVIEPLQVESEVALPRGSSAFRSLLFDRAARFQAATVKSKPITITASALPTPPPGYRGVVGDLSIRTLTNRHQVEAGEPVQFTVVLSGVGNIATLPEPPLQLPPLIEHFGPEITDSIDRSGSRVSGSKTYVYTLVPRSSGRHVVPGFEIPYFDPSEGVYKTLESGTFTIEVTGSVVPAASNVPSTRFPIDDVAPPHDVVSKWIDSDQNPLHKQGWPYILLALPIGVLTGLFLYRKQLERIATNERYAKSRRAHPAARKHLKQAEQLLAQGRGRELYAEIARAVQGYIDNRLGLSAQGLTHARLRGELEERGCSPKLSSGIVEIIEECERAQFSPEPPSAEMMEDVVERAAGLVAGLHEEVKKKGITV